MFNCPDLSGCKKFTICFWAKIEDDANITANWQDIIGFTEQKADNSSTGQLRAESCYGTSYAATSNSRYIHWHDNSNNAISDFYVPYTTTGETQRNVWHHCVLAVDSENGIWAYTDGEPITISGGTVMNGGHLTGQFWLGETNNIQGVINDVRVYKDQILSPRKIKEIAKGLVCHYTLSNGGGENLYTGSKDFSGTWTNLSNWTTSTDTYLNFTVKQRSSICGGMAQNITCSNGDIFTISFYAKVDSGGNIQSVHRSSLGNVTTGLELLSGNFSSGNIWVNNTDNGTSWKRYWATVQITSSDITYLQWRIENSVSGKNMYICGLKLEKGSIATPWTPNSSDTEYIKMGFDDGIEYDVSGYGYNGTKTGTITYDTDTPRYWTSSVFANSTNYSQIRLPEINPTGFTNSWTICAWMKSAGGMGGMVWGGANGNRLNLYLAASILNNTGDASNNPFMNNGSNLPSTLINTGGWHFVAVTGNGSSNDLYIDGEYAGTAKTYKPLTATKYIINGWNENNSYTNQMNMSDFRIYATALSADDILTLYNTPISLSSNGTLLTQGEFTEV